MYVKFAATLPGKLAVAIEKSNHIMAEELLRESGFLLPQTENSKQFLLSLLEKDQLQGFPRETVEMLLGKYEKSQEEKLMSEKTTT